MTHANISRKAAQNVIKIARKYNYTDVKANAKQDLLLSTIASIVETHEHMVKEVAVSIDAFPMPEPKAKASRAVSPTTKTREADESFLALFKQAQQTIASLRAELSKPQSDAESRLADCQRELSETKEALAYAHNSLKKATRYDNAEVTRKLLAENTLLKHDLTHLGKELKQSEEAFEQLRTHNIEQAREIEGLKQQLEQSKSVNAQHVLTVQKLEHQIATFVYEQKQKSLTKAEKETAPATTKTYDNKALATIAALDSCNTIDGKPAHSICGLANLFNLRNVMEAERFVTRLLQTGEICTHVSTSELSARLTDEGNKWRLPNGTLFVTLR